MTVTEFGGYKVCANFMVEQASQSLSTKVRVLISAIQPERIAACFWSIAFEIVAFPYHTSTEKQQQKTINKTKVNCKVSSLSLTSSKYVDGMNRGQDQKSILLVVGFSN